MQTAFAILITVQFIVVVLHDLIHIPGWTHGRQVRQMLGPRKLWIGTAINAIFPGIAVGYVVWFWGSPRPSARAINYWTIYCAVTLGSAIVMWYVPYFFGARKQTRNMYARMYEGTRQILPPRGPEGDNPRPNLLHICFHALFAVNLALILLLRWR